MTLESIYLQEIGLGRTSSRADYSSASRSSRSTSTSNRSTTTSSRSGTSNTGRNTGASPTPRTPTQATTPSRTSSGAHLSDRGSQFTTGAQNTIVNQTNNKLDEIRSKGYVTEKDKKDLESLKSSADKYTTSQNPNFGDTISQQISNSGAEDMREINMPADALTAGFGDVQEFFKKNPKLLYIIGGGIVLTQVIKIIKSRKKHGASKKK